MKTFTLEEAQSLLPVLESLLKRAIEGRQAAEKVESGLTEFARRIYFSGGMKIDVIQVAKLRVELEAHIWFCLAAMQKRAVELGLSGTE